MFPSLHTKDERHVKCKAWNVKRRAPQGSVLHLMLFNILIDDLSYFPRQKGLAEYLCGWSSAGIQPSHVDPVALEACAYVTMSASGQRVVPSLRMRDVTVDDSMRQALVLSDTDNGFPSQ